MKGNRKTEAQKNKGSFAIKIRLLPCLKFIIVKHIYAVTNHHITPESSILSLLTSVL